MNILVTGGAGFIGSHIVNRLAGKEENNILVLDNLERGKEQFLKKSSRINFVHADLRTYEEIEPYFKNIDIVIHMASKVGGIGTYITKPYEIMSENINIDSNVLKASLKNKVSKYIYASSAHVYPKDLQNKIEAVKLKEQDAYPSNCELSYGWAKLIGEKQLEYACQENNFLSCAIARFVGIYGPNQDYNPRTGSVIPVFSYKAIKYPDLKFDVWGTGKETRAYCHIDDALDCIEIMIEKMDNIKFLGPLNVGREELVSISEIAQKIVKISNKNISLEFDNTKKTVIWGQWCDTSLAKRLIGWEARISLEEGLKSVYTDIQERIKNE